MNNIIYISLLFLYLPCYLFAQNNIEQEKLFALKIFNFANELYNEGNYYRSITEYKRFISYFPNSPKVKEAYFKIPFCYYKGQKYKNAIKEFDNIIDKFEDKNLINNCIYYKGLCYYELGDFDNAILKFNSLIFINSTDTVVDKSNYMIGMSYLKKYQWGKSSEAFNNVSENYFLYSQAKTFSRDVLLGKNLTLKNPILSGVLSSIIPGIGYFYTKRYQTGISALLLNGLFAFGTYESFKNNNKTVGLIIGLFGFGWYTGNIFGSVNSAYKYNIDKKKNFISQFD